MMAVDECLEGVVQEWRPSLGNAEVVLAVKIAETATVACDQVVKLCSRSCPMLSALW